MIEREIREIYAYVALITCGTSPTSQNKSYKIYTRDTRDFQSWVKEVLQVRIRGRKGLWGTTWVLFEYWATEEAYVFYLFCMFVHLEVLEFYLIQICNSSCRNLLQDKANMSKLAKMLKLLVQEVSHIMLMKRSIISFMMFIFLNVKCPQIFYFINSDISESRKMYACLRLPLTFFKVIFASLKFINF